jgi:hypothetical protein
LAVDGDDGGLVSDEDGVLVGEGGESGPWDSGLIGCGGCELLEGAACGALEWKGASPLDLEGWAVRLEAGELVVGGMGVGGWVWVWVWDWV